MRVRNLDANTRWPTATLRVIMTRRVTLVSLRAQPFVVRGWLVGCLGVQYKCVGVWACGRVCVPMRVFV